METEILPPFPKLLILNFNWKQPEISSIEILRIFLSFRDAIGLTDFYKLNLPKSATEM